MVHQGKQFNSLGLQNILEVLDGLINGMIAGLVDDAFFRDGRHGCLLAIFRIK
jgi:hypothetical protein